MISFVTVCTRHKYVSAYCCCWRCSGCLFCTHRGSVRMHWKSCIPSCHRRRPHGGIKVAEAKLHQRQHELLKSNMSVRLETFLNTSYSLVYAEAILYGYDLNALYKNSITFW